MKQLSILTLLFSVVALQGQEINRAYPVKKGTTPESEIGMNFLSLLDISIDIYNPDPIFINKSILNGVMYKRHHGKNSLRMGVDIFHYEFSYGYEGFSSPLYYRDHGRTILGELRAGYERSLILKKIRPFMACDLFVGYGRTKGVNEGIDMHSSHYLNYRAQTLQIGIAPALGLQYRPVNNFSITVETNLSLTGYSDKITGKPIPNFERTYTGFDRYFNPVRLLSVNYHFN